jgi:hypothetical protein
MFRRPFLRRRRVIGAAMLGGLGYLVGRRRGAIDAAVDAGPARSASDRLVELDRLHRAGTITDAEYEDKKAEVLEEL